MYFFKGGYTTKQKLVTSGLPEYINSVFFMSCFWTIPQTLYADFKSFGKMLLSFFFSWQNSVYSVAWWNDLHQTVNCFSSYKRFAFTKLSDNKLKLWKEKIKNWNTPWWVVNLARRSEHFQCFWLFLKFLSWIQKFRFKKKEYIFYNLQLIKRLEHLLVFRNLIFMIIRKDPQMFRQYCKHFCSKDNENIFTSPDQRRNVQKGLNLLELISSRLWNHLEEAQQRAGILTE